MIPVTVTQADLILPAYRTPEAEQLPMFAENRIHQRTSGNPYPNRVVVKVDHAHREDRRFRVIRLENEYLRVEILPELGGRIYSALDKTTGYDFLYKQHVIKPALIGMLGPWISGGIEFNWPCHHRPSTFMPVDYCIERSRDGAVTVWLSEHEPLNRMKGMAGVCLAPGSSVIETRMKVYNRGELRRSFLWWQNAAVPVNENYRLFFPPDVEYVEYHYRRCAARFPVASGVYNGIRFGSGVDIRYHRNTRSPTSYFSAQTHYGFFGGYDDNRRAGVVHTADPAISVGKKMFTWAYNQLSRSWERALTDDDGMYAELMAGCYSANQPDFAWLEPYEEKQFEQCWYPIGDMGAPVCATKRAALGLEGGLARVQVTREQGEIRINIDGDTHIARIAPGEVWKTELKREARLVTIQNARGETLLRYAPGEDRPAPMPKPLDCLPGLDEIKTAQDGYLAGVHAYQYRDPAIRPEAYWLKALQIQPDHAPALLRLAERYYDLLFMDDAREHACAAWRAMTKWNYHPESGEIAYVLGLIAEAMRLAPEARDWYQKAAWARDCASRAHTRLAALSGRAGEYADMRAHALEAMLADEWNHMAICALAVADYHLGDAEAAREALYALLEHDPLDLTARALAASYGADVPEAVLLASAYQRALDINDDLALLGEPPVALPPNDNIAFPLRHSEIARLGACADAESAYSLGCALYAKSHYAEAAELWRSCAGDWRAHRNLAVAYYSHLGRKSDALTELKMAVDAQPNDEQLIFEYAYLALRSGCAPEETLAFLKGRDYSRDDIYIEHARALNMCGLYADALARMAEHAFTPCEGGEHAVARQYMFARHALGREAMNGGDMIGALKLFRAAQELPDNLGAGLWHEALLTPHRVYEAECLRALGREAEAIEIERDVVSLVRDGFSLAQLPELASYQIICLKRLGDHKGADALFDEAMAHIALMEKVRDAGYYSTTPFFICYMDDARDARAADARYISAMAMWANGDAEGAKAEAKAALEYDPTNLYARLLANN